MTHYYTLACMHVKLTCKKVFPAEGCQWGCVPTPSYIIQNTTCSPICISHYNEALEPEINYSQMQKILTFI